MNETALIKEQRNDLEAELAEVRASKSEQYEEIIARDAKIAFKRKSEEQLQRNDGKKKVETKRLR